MSYKAYRLDSSLAEMMRTKNLHRDGVWFLSLAEHFDGKTAHGHFALQTHDVMAEYFFDLNLDSTKEGLTAALARGREGGRPKLSESDQAVTRSLPKDPTVLVATIAQRLGIDRKAFYVYFPQARAR